MEATEECTYPVSLETFAQLERVMQRACAEAGLPKGMSAVTYDRRRRMLIWLMPSTSPLRPADPVGPEIASSDQEPEQESMP